MQRTTSLSQRAVWGQGQPISDLMARALANPELISLAAGFVDRNTLPVEPTRQAMEAILGDRNESRWALQYGTTMGYPPLREALLADTLAADADAGAGPRPSIDQVIVTAGSNQLLFLVGDVLIDPGDIVLCAAPTYLVYLGTLSNLGCRTVGVAADRDGMIPEALEERLAWIESRGELDRVKAIYVVSYFENPTGMSLSEVRRPEIVEIARRWSRRQTIYVIEDVAYRELRYTNEDLPSLRTFDEDGDTVVMAGTFSKSYSPGIRVGWGILPRELVAPVCALKGNIDFGSPNFSQHLMSKVLEKGLFAPHVEKLRDSYRTKLEAMLDAADRWLSPLAGVQWIRPRGGLYVWLQLPEEIDTGPAGRLFDTAVDHGMLYVPGQFCYPTEGEPVRRNTIRLSFGVQTGEQIEAGVKALARAIEDVSATS